MSPTQRPLYDANAAWRRALIYFAICWLLGWFSGTLAEIGDRPVLTSSQTATASWWTLTILCTLIILVGYGYIWPKGTLTHGRSLHWPTVILFGLLWGISEGLLFVSVWFTVTRLVSTDWLIILITFFILATFKGLWHSQYWDIHVAPEHNIEAWNLRKVLFAHIPNLACSLLYLTLFGNMVIFVLLQTTALLLSTYFMRFPGPSFR